MSPARKKTFAQRPARMVAKKTERKALIAAKPLPELSWKPRLYRSGGILRYCAPACGGNCRRDLYLIAREKASALLARMPEGWTMQLNENLGWFYKVVSPQGGIAVHQDARTSFTAFLLGGRYLGAGRTPKAAIRVGLVKMEAERDVLLDACAEARRAL